MAADTTIHHQIIFLADGLEAGVAQVRRMNAQEGLSRPYQIEVDLDLPVAVVDPRAWVLGEAQVVVLRADDGATLRRMGGVVTRVRERAARDERQRIHVLLESHLARLRYIQDHRIFQDQTSQQIAALLLDDAGVDPAKVSWRLSAAPPKREVCTQLGETSLAFLSRVLEEDGIYYFFEHGEDGVGVVFADSGSAYQPVSPSAELPFRPGAGLHSTQAVTGIFEIERLRPAKVTLRDHDFKRPALDLTASATGTAPLGREHYDYPGRYVDPAEGARRAKATVEAFDAESTGARGTSTAFSLTPGHTFKLEDAIDTALEQEWVVRDVESLWEDQDGSVRFENRFHVLPSSAPFRPPRRTPRAVVPGPQLAIVTGPPGEEIHTDEHGRVKVHFPWDRRSHKDDKSSCWVRVGQMHTSGSVAIPRVGWEVIVDFEDGDPDKPVILGRLYNGAYGPPYPLPGAKTVSSLQSKSSPGGTGKNEIRMNDGSGGEVFHVHAQKDLNLNVANNLTEKVTTSASVGVGANQKISVGASETLQVGAGCELKVGAAQSWSVGGSRTKSVGADENLSVDGSRSLTIGGSHTITTPRSVSASTPASYSETVGGSCLEAAALDVGMAVAGAASISVGGSKIEACATGKGDITVGAQATTVGGAFIAASGKDVETSVGGAKATTVGGAWVGNAGGDFNLASEGNLNITVGGAVALTGGKVVLKVGGSNVTLSGGAVVITSPEIKLTATGPQPELAPMVEDK